jgi:nucleoside-diphosphate-sugar epimerase
MRVVVLGAGQVGKGLVAELASRGHEVRVARRSNDVVPGATVFAGDARDPAFLARVAEGAGLLFHCANPSAYTSDVWEREFPVMGEAAIAAAKATGAKLVCLDNLYSYGEAELRTEETPRAATGRKGLVRVRWEQRLRDEPGLRWVDARAGDFFGPGTDAQSLFSAAAVAGIAAGTRPWLVGDPTATHAFGYVPDVVRGLAALGESDEVGVWHLPVTQIAPAALVERLAKAAGRSVQPRAVPAWGFRAAAWVVPLFRELSETMYQWDRPFRVDDTKFRTRFPGYATSLDEAVRATLAAAAPAGVVALAA